MASPSRRCPPPCSRTAPQTVGQASSSDRECESCMSIAQLLHTSCCTAAAGLTSGPAECEQRTAPQPIQQQGQAGATCNHAQRTCGSPATKACQVSPVRCMSVSMMGLSWSSCRHSVTLVAAGAHSAKLTPFCPSWPGEAPRGVGCPGSTLSVVASMAGSCGEATAGAAAPAAAAAALALPPPTACMAGSRRRCDCCCRCERCQAWAPAARCGRWATEQLDEREPEYRHQTGTTHGGGGGACRGGSGSMTSAKRHSPPGCRPCCLPEQAAGWQSAARRCRPRSYRLWAVGWLDRCLITFVVGDHVCRWLPRAASGWWQCCKGWFVNSASALAPAAGRCNQQRCMPIGNGGFPVCSGPAEMQRHGRQPVA